MQLKSDLPPLVHINFVIAAMRHLSDRKKPDFQPHVQPHLP